MWIVKGGRSVLHIYSRQDGQFAGVAYLLRPFLRQSHHLALTTVPRYPLSSGVLSILIPEASQNMLNTRRYLVASWRRQKPQQAFSRASFVTWASFTVGSDVDVAYIHVGAL